MKAYTDTAEEEKSSLAALCPDWTTEPGRVHLKQCLKLYKIHHQLSTVLSNAFATSFNRKHQSWNKVDLRDTKIQNQVVLDTPNPLKTMKVLLQTW